MSQTKSAAVPEIPPEIESRRPIPLTQHAADTMPAPRINAGLAAYQAKKKAAKAGKTGPSLRKLAEKLFDEEPLKGMTAAQINEVRGKAYPGQPKMDADMGDRTPAFVNWLFKHHPQDAAKRFIYRDIWPTD